MRVFELHQYRLPLCKAHESVLQNGEGLFFTLPGAEVRPLVVLGGWYPDHVGNQGDLRGREFLPSNGSLKFAPALLYGVATPEARFLLPAGYDRMQRAAFMQR